VLRRNELSSHKKTWGNLKFILLGGRSQFEKATTYCMISTILHSGKGKSMKTIKTSVVATDCKRNEQAEHTGSLGQGNHSIWYYNGGYMS